MAQGIEEKKKKNENGNDKEDFLIVRWMWRHWIKRDTDEEKHKTMKKNT